MEIFLDFFAEIIRQLAQLWSDTPLSPYYTTRTLAQVRKLGPAVQMNIAEKQINAARSVALDSEVAREPWRRCVLRIPHSRSCIAPVQTLWTGAMRVSDLLTSAKIAKRRW
jgi:hypothetical protein